MSSVLTSADLNITRSSTRLHAPPGGHSSITFGSDDTMKQRAPRAITNAMASFPPARMPSEEPPRGFNKQRSTNDSSGMSGIFGSGYDAAPVAHGRFARGQYGGGSSSAMSDVFNHQQSNVDATSSRGRKTSYNGASSISF